MEIYYGGEDEIIYIDTFSPNPLLIIMKTIKLKCVECNNEFKRPLKEHTRSLKLKRPEFCSGTCSTIRRNKDLPLEERKKCYDISQHAGNNRDEYSAFRYFINKSNSKDRTLRYGCSELTLPYLKTLWESQSGICPYTGIKMLLPETTTEHAQIHSPLRASLDRIDSTKGYVEGNVEFVCYSVNMAKNGFTKKETMDFFNAIVSF